MDVELAVGKVIDKTIDDYLKTKNRRLYMEDNYEEMNSVIESGDTSFENGEGRNLKIFNIGDRSVPENLYSIGIFFKCRYDCKTIFTAKNIKFMHSV